MIANKCPDCKGKLIQLGDADRDIAQCENCKQIFHDCIVREVQSDNPLARIWNEDGTIGIATGTNTPDLSRVLTDEEIRLVDPDECACTIGNCRAIAKTQDIKTSSIYQTEIEKRDSEILKLKTFLNAYEGYREMINNEHQQKIKEIFGEIEQLLRIEPFVTRHVWMNESEWQSLKKKYL